MTLFWHRILGFFSVCSALTILQHAFSTRQGIHPFTSVGWMQEQLTITAILFGIGLLFALWRRDWETPGAVFAADALALFAGLTFLRFFWLSSAVLCLGGVVDALLWSGRFRRESALLGSVFVVLHLWVFVLCAGFCWTSYQWVGA